MSDIEIIKENCKIIEQKLEEIRILKDDNLLKTINILSENEENIRFIRKLKNILYGE